jgi:Ca-activated chloride channel homolog
VDEVILTFHAADMQGVPVRDLKLDELHLLDNSKPPRRVLAFDSLEDAPIRTGILIDTSVSMELQIAGTRALALQYARKLLQKPADQAFVMDFGSSSHLQRDWTSDPAMLAPSVQSVRAATANAVHGTAIFGAVFRACYSQFGHAEHDKSGNFILLFSDGEDNASNVTIDEAINMCQQSNTTIYAINMNAAPVSFSTGPETLKQLAMRTGGRVLSSSTDNAQIESNLQSIELEQRNQYRLVYNPSAFPHDGSFHRIDLSGPARVAKIQVRSGYYAPAQ